MQVQLKQKKPLDHRITFLLSGTTGVAREAFRYLPGGTVTEGYNLRKGVTFFHTFIDRTGSRERVCSSRGYLSMSGIISGCHSRVGVNWYLMDGRPCYC